MMTKFAGELLGQDDVQALLDNLSNAQFGPILHPNQYRCIPNWHSAGALAERMPISDLRRILETLANLSGKNLSVSESAEAQVWPCWSASPANCPASQPLPVITLSSELEYANPNGPPVR